VDANAALGARRGKKSRNEWDLGVRWVEEKAGTPLGGETSVQAREEIPKRHIGGYWEKWKRTVKVPRINYRSRRIKQVGGWGSRRVGSGCQKGQGGFIRTGEKV